MASTVAGSAAAAPVPLLATALMSSASGRAIMLPVGGRRRVPFALSKRIDPERRLTVFQPQSSRLRSCRLPRVISEEAEGNSSIEENIMDEQALESNLEAAIKDEDYPRAAKIRDRLRVLHEDSKVAVLSANARFYNAFKNGDLAAMHSIWAKGEHVYVIHPAAGRISGYDMVMGRLAGAPAPESVGFEALAASGLGSSSEILESASVEGVEPVVRACVEGLGSTSPEAKREAAARIRLLAKHRSDFRTLIGASGAIPALVPLLRSTDPETQESAATALLNLSLEEANKGRIAAAGAIKPLVYALRTGTAVTKQNAACALLNLSMIEENRATIGACGAIPPLVALLVGGSCRGKKDALTTLYKLCSTRRNKERAVSAGAVAPLVGMVGEPSGGTSEKAMVVLGSLAAIPEGQEAIVEAGGIPALVEAIEAGPARGREFAVHALLLLCTDNACNRGLLVREGAIPPLVALSQCGSARAKLKAETLLGYLREQRQDMAR